MSVYDLLCVANGRAGCVHLVLCFVLAPAPDPLQGFTHGHGRVDLTPKVGTQQTQQEPESACVRV